MAKFYFTYGLGETQPFRGGWTVVEAEDRKHAEDAFTAFHPLHDGLLNCSIVYPEDMFKRTAMYEYGNFDAREQEHIVIARFYPDQAKGAGAWTK